MVPSVNCDRICDLVIYGRVPGAVRSAQASEETRVRVVFPTRGGEDRAFDGQEGATCTSIGVLHSTIATDAGGFIPVGAEAQERTYQGSYDSGPGVGCGTSTGVFAGRGGRPPPCQPRHERQGPRKKRVRVFAISPNDPRMGETSPLFPSCSSGISVGKLGDREQALICGRAMLIA